MPEEQILNNQDTISEVEPEVEIQPQEVPEVDPSEDTEKTETNAEEKSKVYTQEQLDKIIAKRLDREARKFKQQLERVTLERSLTTDKHDDFQSSLHIEDFDNEQAYIDAKVEEKLAFKSKKLEDLKQYQESTLYQNQIDTNFDNKVEDFKDDNPDYDNIVHDRLPVSPAMAEVIKLSDVGPEIAYFLGKNPDECSRIFQLNPILQIKEIGKIESTLGSKQNIPAVSKAPSPINPLNGKGTAKVPTFDTTDPRSVDSMSMDDWAKAEKLRLSRK